MTVRSWSSHLPGLRLVTRYQRSWVPRDLGAGVVLTAILVPQGMAYAELAGLPAITGLYTTILCLAGYALVGPSRILVLGPDSSLGPMIASTIIPLAGADHSPARAIALASMLAILSGAIMLAAGLGRLGFVADLLSKPTQIGYMTGLALTILVGQLPKLFGFSVESDNLIGDVRGFVDGLASGKTVPAAIGVGLFGLALILVLQRWLPKVPGVLVAVVLSIAAAALFDLEQRGVSLVGTLPKGFPPFTIPSISASDLPLLVSGALGISLVALTDTISTASAFAARAGDQVRPDDEMVGIGVANIAAGLFQGFPVSTSGSRTAVAEQSGSRTQLTGLVGAGLIVVMLVAIPGLLRDLPQPTLGAVVIAAALSLAEVAALHRLWSIRRAEFSLGVAAFLGVALLGVLPGIAVAVALSILNVFRRAWWPYSTQLGRVPGLPGYHDVHTHPDAAEPDGVVVFRFDAPLFFANMRSFREQILGLAADPRHPRWIVVAAEPITDVDTTAAEMLDDVDDELRRNGITLVFAELKDPVHEKIERYGLSRWTDAARFYPTVESALEEISRGGDGEQAGAGTPFDAAGGDADHRAERTARAVTPGNEEPDC